MAAMQLQPLHALRLLGPDLALAVLSEACLRCVFRWRVLTATGARGSAMGSAQPPLPGTACCLWSRPACLPRLPHCLCSGHWLVPLQSAVRIVQGVLLQLGAGWARVSRASVGIAVCRQHTFAT